MIALFWKSVFRPHMDFKIQTGEDFETQIVERPGRWMPQDELTKLSDSLAQIASHTLPRGGLNYGVFSGDPQNMKDIIVTLVRRRSDGKPVAFNALALMEVDLGEEQVTVLHLGLVMVDPNEQSRGLSWVLYGLTCMLFFFRSQFRPVWISNVTQVPAIVGMVSETFSQVFPVPGRGKKRSLMQLLLARRIMKKHRRVFGVGEEATFDETRFVIANAYTGGSEELKKSYEDAPKHRSDIYNMFCRNELDYERGDDFLQLGKIDFYTLTRYLKDKVPRNSLSAFLVAGILLLTQRLFLPLLYWFDGSKPWGILRARPR